VKVTVRSLGPIRQVLGAAEVEVTLPEGATFPGLLTKLVEEKGEKFAPYARPTEGTLYAPLRIVVNGRDLTPAQGSKLVLADGDDVLIFLPIAGG
jgi:molybdopterin converting factor small subunit